MTSVCLSEFLKEGRWPPLLEGYDFLDLIKKQEMEKKKKWESVHDDDDDDDEDDDGFVESDAHAGGEDQETEALGHKSKRGRLGKPTGSSHDELWPPETQRRDDTLSRVLLYRFILKELLRRVFGAIGPTVLGLCRRHQTTSDGQYLFLIWYLSESQVKLAYKPTSWGAGVVREEGVV